MGKSFESEGQLADKPVGKENKEIPTLSTENYIVTAPALGNGVKNMLVQEIGQVGDVAYAKKATEEMLAKFNGRPDSVIIDPELARTLQSEPVMPAKVPTETELVIENDQVKVKLESTISEVPLVAEIEELISSEILSKIDRQGLALPTNLSALVAVDFNRVLTEGLISELSERYFKKVPDDLEIDLGVFKVNREIHKRKSLKDLKLQLINKNKKAKVVLIELELEVLSVLKGMLSHEKMDAAALLYKEKERELESLIQESSLVVTDVIEDTTVHKSDPREFRSNREIRSDNTEGVRPVGDWSGVKEKRGER